MSYYIHIDKFNSNECPKGGYHDEESGVIMYRTRKGETRYMNDNKYYQSNSTMPRPEHRRMRVVGGSVACSKCGTPYIESHNPYHL